MGLWLNYTEIFPQKCPVWLLLPPQAASCPSRLLLSPQAPLPELSACSPWDPKSPQISTSGRSAPSQEAWPQLEDLEVSSWQALRHLGPRQAGPQRCWPISWYCRWRPEAQGQSGTLCLFWTSPHQVEGKFLRLCFICLR